MMLGAEGVTALCLGLRTNGTLKQLHLPYCAIGPPGGAPLAEMLSYSKLALTTLNLQVAGSTRDRIGATRRHTWYLASHPRRARARDAQAAGGGGIAWRPI